MSFSWGRARKTQVLDACPVAGGEFADDRRPRRDACGPEGPLQCQVAGRGSAVGHQQPELPVVGFVHNLNLAQAAFALGGLFGQNVIGVGLCEGEFAGPGFPEPFGGAPVRLDLWHNMNSWRFVLRLKYGEALKSQKPDGFEKSSISRRANLEE
jgi:hypothetical protein